MCSYENCKIHSFFNFENEKKTIYCFEHKLDEMIDIKNIKI